MNDEDINKDKMHSVDDESHSVDKSNISNENGINNADSKETFDLEGLSAYMQSHVAEQDQHSIPPLEQWNPKRCGSMDLVIKANGEWWHEGSKITRESLVQLFSSVLWPEDNDGMRQYYLKTPVEKLLIKVEDVPFLINDVNIVIKDNVSWLVFTSKTGEVIYLDEQHPIVMREYAGEVQPYIEVRFGMYGLITRSVLMHLVQLGALNEQDGVTTLTLQSGGYDHQVAVEE